jgi:hypothetical protein
MARQDRLATWVFYLYNTEYSLCRICIWGDVRKEEKYVCAYPIAWKRNGFKSVKECGVFHSREGTGFKDAYHNRNQVTDIVTEKKGKAAQYRIQYI